MALFSDLTYQILANGAKQTSTDPRDYLVVFASESMLDPSTTKGTPFHGFNTMGKQAAVNVGIDPDFWELLPDLGPEDNMRASMQFFLENLRRYRRNGFANALDAYLFNFAPSIWATNAGPDTVIYEAPSSAYYENATMDNYPALANYALANKIAFKTSKDVAATAKQALEQGGILKGKITVADLRAFLMRPGASAIWRPHVDRLTALGLAPSEPYERVAYQEYNPDVGWQDFAKERQARAGGALPPAPSPEPGLVKSNALAWFVAGTVAAAAGLLWWHVRQPKRRSLRAA